MWTARSSTSMTSTAISNGWRRNIVGARFGDALQHNNADVSSLVGLYAKISRMRVLSSAAVIERADKIARMIVDTYLGPNKSFPELREMMISGSLDPLRDFSEACRTELRPIRPQQY